MRCAEPLQGKAASSFFSVTYFRLEIKYKRKFVAMTHEEQISLFEALALNGAWSNAACNYKEGTETVAFGEAVKAEKSSDMSARGAPDIERQIVRFGVFCYVTPKNRGLHGQCTAFARSAFRCSSAYLP